jgi:hypothetical protein
MQQKKGTKRVFEPNQRLWTACRNGWLKVARTLVKAGTSVDGVKTHVTPLLLLVVVAYDVSFRECHSVLRPRLVT